MAPVSETSRGLTRFAWLSVATSVVTITLKLAAWRLTGSVGLLSDALESFVNLAAAAMTLAMLVVAARPPDDDHAYGYGKAEYFASGAEGVFILLAACGIAWAAVERFLAPQPIERPGAGLAISIAASLANLVVARVLLGAGRRYGSIALEADGKHLLTDVWTSVGVVLAVVLVAVTGWLWLDPTIALVVAAQIIWSGGHLVRRSWLGLLDRAIPPAELETLKEVLARHRSELVHFHAVRTRQAGLRRFVTMHVLVPGDWTVQRGHALAERIEEDVRAALPNATVLTHLEALEDPASFQDQDLDRLLPDTSPRP